MNMALPESNTAPVATIELPVAAVQPTPVASQSPAQFAASQPSVIQPIAKATSKKTIFELVGLAVLVIICFIIFTHI